jgi:hypothetical protein
VRVPADCSAGGGVAWLWVKRWGVVLPALSLIGAGAAPSPAMAGTSVETVSFAGRPAVKIVRGNADRPAAGSVEIVSFGTTAAGTVRVVRGARGGGAGAQVMAAGGALHNIETVGFADPHQPQVTIVRGAGSVYRGAPFDLFAGAPDAELDRVAFAVDGVESSHGGDPRMWRDEPSGPQGPMQVSAAAAIDVGGGNRFDERQNRALGRAYLARMFARYGDWPDAIAAYNWGPGNLDLWIGAGRPVARLPLDVERYVERVLRDALSGASLPLDPPRSRRSGA